MTVTRSARRTGDRRLGERLRQRLTPPGPPADPGAEVADRLVIRAALARLGEPDREVLTLTVGEEPQPREGARRRPAAAGVTGRAGCAWIAEWLRAKEIGCDG